MREEIRIPIFNDSFTFFYDEIADVPNDIVNPHWIDEKWKPVSYERLEPDPIARYEMNRILKYRTCPFCHSKMEDIALFGDYGNIILVCKSCFYWAGKGSRGDHLFIGSRQRASLGRMNIIKNPDDVNINLLINYLSNVCLKQ